MPAKAILKRISGAAAIAAMFTVATPFARAADFPSKPVRLIVGFAPGGSNDIIARLLAPKLEAELKQSVVVENRPGAGGNIAADAVVKAAPDGHMVFMCTTGTLSIQPFLPVRMPFDVKDITPVTQIGNTPYLMLVSKQLPVSNVGEFLQYAKANPGKVNFASSGNGTTAHLAGEMLRAQAGIDIVHVPYKGAGQAMVDLTSGLVSLMFDQAVSSASYISAGTLKALAVASDRRLPGLPELPTTEESGLPRLQSLALDRPVHGPRRACLRGEDLAAGDGARAGRSGDPAAFRARRHRTRGQRPGAVRRIPRGRSQEVGRSRQEGRHPVLSTWPRVDIPRPPRRPVT